MKVDIHTHQPLRELSFGEKPKEISIYCHANYREEIPHYDGPLCLGLHPWFLPENEEEESQAFEFLTKQIKENKVFALGECGLDRLKGPMIEIQERYLKKQLELAHDLNMPIVILHCVRAYPEIQKVLKESAYNDQVIFHDYGANEQITQQLLTNPNVFFSLGRALERDSFCKNTIPLLPRDRIFLETDDDSLTIDQRYQQLAKILDLSVEQIETELSENYNKIKAFKRV